MGLCALDVRSRRSRAMPLRRPPEPRPPDDVELGRDAASGGHAQRKRAGTAEPDVLARAPDAFPGPPDDAERPAERSAHPRRRPPVRVRQAGRVLAGDAQGFAPVLVPVGGAERAAVGGLHLCPGPRRPPSGGVPPVPARDGRAGARRFGVLQGHRAVPQPVRRHQLRAVRAGHSRVVPRVRRAGKRRGAAPRLCDGGAGRRRRTPGTPACPRPQPRPSPLRQRKRKAVRAGIEAPLGQLLRVR